MAKTDPTAATRLFIGAVAGLAGTVAMTSAMLRMHRLLPPAERYPLPPREVVEAASLEAPLSPNADTALIAHLGFGALVGALLGLARPMPSAREHAIGAVGVWAVSYLGLFPGLGLLKPATRHPWRRNLLMVAAHLVWGPVTALAARELAKSRTTILSAGEARDVQRER